jgi:hypothetical protein
MVQLHHSRPILPLARIIRRSDLVFDMRNETTDDAREDETSDTDQLVAMRLAY